MSLVVKLEDQLGEHGEWVMLHGIIPGQDAEDFPLLRGIDLYGTTIFNHLQMTPFLAEWERVREHARDENQQDAWQRIKKMAETCRDDRDLSLKFVGN